MSNSTPENPVYINTDRIGEPGLSFFRGDGSMGEVLEGNRSVIYIDPTMEFWGHNT